MGDGFGGYIAWHQIDWEHHLEQKWLEGDLRS
jgi:hypothetical protein